MAVCTVTAELRLRAATQNGSSVTAALSHVSPLQHQRFDRGHPQTRSSVTWQTPFGRQTNFESTQASGSDVYQSDILCCRFLTLWRCCIMELEYFAPKVIEMGMQCFGTLSRSRKLLISLRFCAVKFVEVFGISLFWRFGQSGVPSGNRQAK